MADFLTRLAARAIGEAPGVRPVLPPRFAALSPPRDPDQQWWTKELRDMPGDRTSRDLAQGAPSGPGSSKAGESGG
jgi:hypothetical protein